MISTVRILVCATILTGSDLARAADDIDLSNLARYERNGKLDLKALERDYRRQQKTTVAKSTPQQRLKGIGHLGSALIRPVAPAGSEPQPNAFLSQPVVSSLAFVLRKDFSDIYLFTNPTPDEDAEGAEFSWARNRTANDTIWTANGMGALAYTYFVNSYDSPLIGISVAPYLQVTKEIHSNPSNDDTDSITVGATGEVGLRNLFGLGKDKSDYFRLRAALTDDRIKERRIAHLTGEWLPTWLTAYGSIPGTPIVYNFLPELKVQYASTDAGKVIPFSGQQQALRVGPEATLLFGVYDPALPEHLQFLRRISGKITYHWWTEVYSGRTANWLSTSLIYNLDDSGNLAISASYKRGPNEETGVNTNLFKIALTGKMCAELGGGKCAGLSKKAQEARTAPGGG